jgi:hypothetical protein
MSEECRVGGGVLTELERPHGMVHAQFECGIDVFTCCGALY